MKGEKRQRRRNWCPDFSPLVFILLVLFAFSFYSVPAAAVQSDVGYFMIDGQKTIPMGWYKMEEQNPAAGWPDVDNLELGVIDESSDHGFDFVMQYYPWRSVYNPWGPDNDAEVLAYMDYAESKDVKIMIDVHNTDAPTTAYWVSVVKDHNALYGYYLEDEPAARH